MAFLDLVISRNDTNKTIEFDIYRKPTSTSRFITVESHHHLAHKYSAFHSMVHRLVSLPLSEVNYEKEVNTIYQIANINGYTKESIDALIRRHKQKLFERNCSSFFHSQAPKKFRVAVSYNDSVFGSIKNCLAKYDICAVPKSKNKICNLIHSTKDKINIDERPGIYTAKCATEGCESIYIGQTQRFLKLRIGEHLRDIRNGDTHKSGFAEHIIENGHAINKNDFKLVEMESNYRRINILESMHIHLNKNNMNRDVGPAFSPLYDVLMEKTTNTNSEN